MTDMAEPTVQQPVGHRLGLLVRAVPLLRRKARVGAGTLHLRLDLAVTDDADAAAALERILGVLGPGDRVYVVGPPDAAEPRFDDRPFTIWA
jgi:hypothetical protein